MNRSERTLQRWVPDGEDSTSYSLEAGSATNWDQFATHQQMTGGQSTYTEEQYTTSINRNAPDFKEKEARAARLAREIEAEQSTNTHVREERGQAAENDGDEEEKYSGVRRDFQPLSTNNGNKYTPPAMRAPSNQPTMAGAPFDPAIISSQLARGDKPTTSNQPTNNQPRASSMMQSSAEPVPILRSNAPSTTMTNGTTAKPTLPIPSSSAQQPETEQASQGVESKVLEHFRQFANQERTRLADRKLKQATQDRTAKINDLVRFSKTFKLKTPIPNDLVGILAKDPKKQADIVDKAIEDAKTSAVSSPTPSASVVNEPPTTKFDKSQIPPPIPDRTTFAAGRAGYGKPAIGRGARSNNQQMPFPANVPVAPRNSSFKNGQIPAPIPMPELKNGHALNSGLSSPQGIETPTSAVSSKFNVRASEFRPTAQAFNPSSASVSAASPSPIKRIASVARATTPSSFYGQRKTKSRSEKLDMSEKFNPIAKLKNAVQADLAKKSEGPVRDYKANGGIPNAFHTQPVWLVSEENQDKSWDESFNKPPPASPAQNRGPYQGQMQPVMGVPMMQNMSHHGHPSNSYQQQFEEQRMHMHNGPPQAYTPNMTPRSQFVSPMNHHAQPAYGQQPYFMNNRNMPMQGYGGNPAMMHGHSGQLSAPMMVNQHSSGPYLAMQPPNPIMYSPAPGHAYPQHVNNGYPSPGRQMQAPAMMHQGSQQGFHAAPQMYSGSPYGGQQQRPSYGGGGHTPYGTSPHQPHAMNQRAMSSGYMQKAMPQMNTNGAPGNGPQQSNNVNQVPLAEETK